MINTSLWNAALVALSLAVATGCGGDDGMTGDGGNALGVRCGPDQPDCPADHTCVVQPVPDGSGMQGYCSPVCVDDVDCTEGYAGPGDPVCFSNDECTIVCSDMCPEGLTCLPTGGPTDVCAVEMGTGDGGGAR